MMLLMENLSEIVSLRNYSNKSRSYLWHWCSYCGTIWLHWFRILWILFSNYTLVGIIFALWFSFPCRGYSLSVVTFINLRVLIITSIYAVSFSWIKITQKQKPCSMWPIFFQIYHIWHYNLILLSKRDSLLSTRSSYDHDMKMLWMKIIDSFCTLYNQDS